VGNPAQQRGGLPIFNQRLSGKTDLNTPINRIVPLAPDLAIRIRPDIRLRGTTPDLTFAKVKVTRALVTTVALGLMALAVVAVAVVVTAAGA
jgi:hypothetical protein